MVAQKPKKQRHLCRDCPADAKLVASYPDEKGKTKRLCTEHAKRAGSWVARKEPPCRDCPAGAKLRAHYPDEEGKARRLCAEHAKRAGSWVRCQARPSPSQLRSATYKPWTWWWVLRLRRPHHVKRNARWASSYMYTTPCRRPRASFT